VFAGVFFSATGFGKVAVVVFYIRIGGAVAELTLDGWPAGGGAGRFFSDDTFALVAIVAFCHRSRWDEMPRSLVV
jgi:hypothetical protein